MITSPDRRSPYSHDVSRETFKPLDFLSSHLQMGQPSPLLFKNMIEVTQLCWISNLSGKILKL